LASRVPEVSLPVSIRWLSSIEWWMTSKFAAEVRILT